MCFKKYKGIKGLQDMFEAFAARRNAELKDRTRFKDAEECAKCIGEIFNETCACHLLKDGCFVIEDDEGKQEMYLTDIEFYYHEEVDVEKRVFDHAMYHIQEKYDKPLPFFNVGTLNFHVSGVDVTFEDEIDKQYRASFLIRGYTLYLNGNEIKKETEHPTHIYDDLFKYGFPVCEPLNIRWKPSDMFKNCKVSCDSPRKNITTNYKEEINSKGKPVFMKMECAESPNGTFNIGKNKYEQCSRQWRFKRVD